MLGLSDSQPQKAAQASSARNSRSRTATLTRNRHETPRTQSESSREFQVLLLDDQFPKLLNRVSQSLQNLTSALEVEGFDKNNLSTIKKNLEFANYNSVYLALKVARSSFRKFARNKTTATNKEKKLFYIKAIQILPILKKIDSLQAPKLRSLDEPPFLTKDSFLFDFVIADSLNQNPCMENALKQVQRPILVGGNLDGLRYGLDKSYANFAWKIFDEKFQGHQDDLNFEAEQVRQGKNPSAKNLADLLPLQIEEMAVHKALEELVIEPIKELAQSTYLELNRAIGNKARLLSQMTDLDINSEISRYQLSPKEKQMSIKELLARDNGNEDQVMPQIVVKLKKTKTRRNKPTLKDLFRSKILSNPLEILINLQDLIKDSLLKKHENLQEQIYREVMSQIEPIDRNEVLQMTLSENERAYKVLVEIVSTLNANGLNNKKVHDAINNLITINSQAIYIKGNHRSNNQSLNANAVEQEIEKQNIFQILNTTLDKMIEMAKTWTMPNLNLIESLRTIAKGKNSFKLLVLKQIKFSKKELEILQGKIRDVISSVPKASHDNSFITNLIEIDKFISDQLSENASKARSNSSQTTQARLRKVNIPQNNLPRIRNPLGQWKDTISQLQKVVSKRIEIAKNKLEPLLDRIVTFSRYKSVQDQVPFESIEEQIFRAYNTFSQRNFNKMPRPDYLRIQDLFLSTAIKLEDLHNPRLAA